MTVYDDGLPRGLWRLGRIEELMQSADGEIRGVLVKVTSKKGHVKVLRQPVQHIYPLEIRDSSSSLPPDNCSTSETPDGDQEHNVECIPSDATNMHPVRRPATQARDHIVGCLIGDQC